jgi:methyl-accepting chemotaxis protein
MRLTIGRKLGISFGIIIFLVAVNSVIAYVQMANISAARARAHTRTEKLNYVYVLVAQTNRLNSDVKGWILDRELKDFQNTTRLKARMASEWQEMDTALGELQRLDSTFSEKDKAILSNITSALAEQKQRQVTFATESEASDGSQNLWPIYSGRVKDSSEEIRGLLADLLRDINAEQDAEAKTSGKQAAFGQKVLISFSLLVMVLGSALAYFISRRVSTSTRRLAAGAERISQGDLRDLDLQDLNSSDEIGELSRSFSAMVSYLQEMAAISERIAAGELSQDVQPHSAHDTLGLAFVRMTEGLRTMVRGVRDSAAQVASGSTQVASASHASASVSVQAAGAINDLSSTMHEMSVNVQNMVQSTQIQASSVNETSASIDQMVVSIQRIADSSTGLFDISNRSRDEVKGGLASMEKATDGLSRINTSIQSSAELIESLGDRVENIGNIVSVIDDLADQTNLLALNAAIEAARAGEHGMGFAVVADEIRKLAEKSAQSTKEISELIQTIQREARKAVENMEKSTGIVEEGIGLGGELGDALRRISTVVAEVYKFAQDIQSATREQSAGSSQIAQATSRLNEITQETSSAVEEQAAGTHAVVDATERMRELAMQSSSSSSELAASAEQMAKMSGNLLKMMDRFSLDSAQESTRGLPSNGRYALSADSSSGLRARGASAS